MNLDITNNRNLKKALSTLEKDDTLFLDDHGITKYAVIDMDLYDEIQELMENVNDDGQIPMIKVVGQDGLQLTYDEYEKIKKQLNEALEKTLKPNPEKLN